MEEGDLHLCDIFEQCEKSNKNLDLKSLSFDMWGTTRIKNFQKLLGENKFLKDLRLKLFEAASNFLNQIEVDWFVYAGTALAVYREKGCMIAHDSDVDVAILEKDFSKVCSHLKELESKGIVVANSRSSLKKESWFQEDGSEIKYDGIDCKRIKFYLNRNAWMDSQNSDEQLLYKKLQSIKDPDPGLIHLDIFTFGVHPTVPNSYRVNWALPNLYDNSRAFSHNILFPLKDAQFEGYCVKIPNEIEAYLTIEYGYLGRDAMYDFNKKSYIKIPDNMYEALPNRLQKQMPNS